MKPKTGTDWTHLCEAVPGYWKPTPIRMENIDRCIYCHKTEKKAKHDERQRAEE